VTVVMFDVGRSSVVVDSSKSFGVDPLSFDYVVREANASSLVHVIPASRLRSISQSLCYHRQHSVHYVLLCTYERCYFAFTDCVIIIVVALFALHCYSAIWLSS